jgi:hypothetical protein
MIGNCAAKMNHLPLYEEHSYIGAVLNVGKLNWMYIWNMKELDINER